MEFEIKEIIYSKRKSVSMQFVDDGKLLVKAPVGMSYDEIKKIITKHSLGLNRLLKKHLEKQKSKAELKEGQEFYFLGKIYKLKFSDKAKEPDFVSEELTVYFKPTENWREIFINFYKKKAKEYFNERLVIISKYMGVSYSKFRLSNAKTRWGTCSSNKTISLNWRLIMANPGIIDYVIVHELCHLRHPNHSRYFWNEVAKYFPDYREAKKWFRDEGYLLFFLDKDY